MKLINPDIWSYNGRAIYENKQTHKYVLNVQKARRL